jgi:uncharacterized protein (TIGR00369 family)
VSILRAEWNVERFNAIGENRLPGLLGLTVTTLSAKRLGATLEVRDDHLAPNGFLHAGTVVTLADTAAGYGCLAHLPESATGFTTIELKSNHLGTVREGSIACVATAAHLGRTTHVWDATVTNADNGKTIALFRCTQMILYPKP